MSDMDVKEVIGDLGKAFEEFKATHTAEIAEIKKNGVPDPVTSDKLGKIEKSLDALEDMKKRIESIEVKANRPSLKDEKDAMTKEQKAHLDAFEAWVRRPADNDRKNALMHAALEAKTASSSTGSAGHAIPEVIGRRIYEVLQQESPMRQVLTVQTVGTSDYKELVDVNGETTGWVGETDTRSATSEPVLKQIAPTMGELYAYPSVYEHILDDAFFNVSEWLIRKVGGAFARAEGEAFISGNGTNKPTGFLSGTTPAATADFTSPARAFGTLEYVPTGDANGFGDLATSSPTHYPADVFFDAITALRPRWRMGAVWLMNTTTKGVIRKFKDADGNYLLRPGLEVGEGSQILGYRTVEMDHMPDIAANAFPVAFGNFSEAYCAVDRTGLRITTDDNITSPGQVKFFVRRRVGGILRNDQPLKLIKCAAS